ncbi:MAG: 16S rRNA (guanine(966)-N(2))-methyltransferase RsmD [Acholeplasmataceae bacterium]
MRVTGGEHRSRILKMVPDKETRETSDKIRESVFNVLGDKVINSEVLDLFAGSGAYGIDALSRKSKKCMFSDTKLSAVKTIHQNIDALSLKEKSIILKNDYLNIIKLNKNKNQKFDIIFLDPPYDKYNYEELINLSNEILKDDGVIVLELLNNTIINEELIDLQIYKTKKYGSKKIHYLK